MYRSTTCVIQFLDNNTIGMCVPLLFGQSNNFNNYWYRVAKNFKNCKIIREALYSEDKKTDK